MTHTPGPWKIIGPSPGNQIRNMDDGGDYAITNDGAIIAEAFCRVKTDRYEDSKANAHLIAAAPDLLEACEFALNELSDMTSMQFAHGADKEARQRLENAIAKAKGGE